METNTTAENRESCCALLLFILALGLAQAQLLRCKGPLRIGRKFLCQINYYFSTTWSWSFIFQSKNCVPDFFAANWANVLQNCFECQVWIEVDITLIGNETFFKCFQLKKLSQMTVCFVLFPITVFLCLFFPNSFLSSMEENPCVKASVAHVVSSLHSVPLNPFASAADLTTCWQLPRFHNKSKQYILWTLLRELWISGMLFPYESLSLQKQSVTQLPLRIQKTKFHNLFLPISYMIVQSSSFGRSTSNATMLFKTFHSFKLTKKFVENLHFRNFLLPVHCVN